MKTKEGKKKQSTGDDDYFHNYNYDHDYVQIMLSVGPETYLGLLAQ
jgi:hypothetical protein